MWQFVIIGLSYFQNDCSIFPAIKLFFRNLTSEKMSWPDLTKVTLIGRFLVKFLITAFNRVPGRVPQLRPKMSQRTKFIFVQKKAFYDRTAQKRLEFRSEKFLFVISIHGKSLNSWFLKFWLFTHPMKISFRSRGFR